VSNNIAKVNVDPHDVYLNSLPHRYDINDHQNKLYPKKLDNDIYEVYDEHGHLSGKFMISNGALTVLSDYYGMVTKNFPQGPLDEVSTLMVKEPLGGLKVVSRSDIKNGLYTNNIPDAKFGMKYEDKVFEDKRSSLPPSVFHYHREGMSQPHTIEISNGKALLDGNVLSEDETNRILENVQNKLGHLRYKSLTKSEAIHDEPLVKAKEITPEDAMSHISGLVGSGHVRPEIEQALRRHIFEDPMTPGLGNKYSFETFKNKSKPGYYLSLDANNFKHINDTHGHSAGDSAIKTIGNAIRTSIDSSPYKNAVKGFRSGGDEFVLHAESPEAAHHVLRSIHGQLDQVPAIGGTHKITMSSGLGRSYEEADSALLEAKKKKTDVPAHLHHSTLDSAKS